MQKEGKRKVKVHYSRKENLTGVMFVVPALIPLLIFWVIPVVWSGGLSFTDWDMMSENINFMGLKNFASLLRDPKFGDVLWNTLVFAVGSTVPTIVLGLLVALLMNGARKGTGVYRTVIFAPYITPMVAVSVVWSWIFEPRVGILNYILGLWTSRQSVDTKQQYSDAQCFDRDCMEGYRLDHDLLYGSASEGSAESEGGSSH